MGIKLTILKISPEVFVWYFTESVASEAGHFTIAFVNQNVTGVSDTVIILRR